MAERIWKSLIYGAVATVVSVFLSYGFVDRSIVLPAILTFAGMTAVAYRFIFDHLG